MGRAVRSTIRPVGCARAFGGGCGCDEAVPGVLFRRNPTDRTAERASLVPDLPWFVGGEALGRGIPDTLAARLAWTSGGVAVPST